MPYLPLDRERSEIRVLKIEATDPSSTLVKCSLEQVSLQDLSLLYKKCLAALDLIGGGPEAARAALNEWIRVSRNVGGEPNSSSTLRILYSRWEHTKQGLDFSFESQAQDKFEDLQLLPRYNWGDFEALSYCWESEKLEKVIILDGNIIKVPRNLESALLALQRLPETGTGMRFWVDYLCIKQDDNVEKSHQVNLMSDIYSSALSVIAWLGPEEHESDDVLQFIRTAESIDLHHPVLHAKLRAPQLWKGFHNFLSREYWRRLWIVQELCLNHNMTLCLYGSHALSRRQIQVACALYNNKIHTAIQLQNFQYVHEDAAFSYLQYGTSQARHVSALLGLNTQPTTSRIQDQLRLDRLLQIGRKAGAKDPRDKVYGLLGILPPTLASKIYPNYELSTAAVYISFAKAVLDTASRLDAIFSWCTYTGDNGMPSWVPDWSVPFDRFYLLFLKSPHFWDEKKNPPEQIIPSWQIESPSNHLICRGIIIDTITTTGLSPKPIFSHHRKSSPLLNPSQGFPLVCQHSSFEAVKASLIRTLQLNHPGFNLSPQSILDIYWIDWDMIEKADADDRQLSALWTWGMAQITRNRHLWRGFDYFRLANESFSVLGYPLRSFFPDMLTYPRPGDEAVLSINAYGIKSDSITSSVKSKAEDPSMPIIHESILQDLRCTMRSLTERKLATTEFGYLALVTDAALVGDVVAFIHGCKFPVILRRKGNLFLYIGECYVDGIMKDEELHVNMRGEYEEEEIRIC